MKKTAWGQVVLEGQDIADLPLLSKNAEIVEAKVREISGDKVDKIKGKGLSTNDYTNADKAEVAKVKNKADKTYVDGQYESLKQSGIEINKIVVDGLNFHKTSATINDSLRVNASKIKSIKGGDYNIGDEIDESKVKLVTNFKDGRSIDIIWTFEEHKKRVHYVASDIKGCVYSAGWTGRVIKKSPEGRKIWEYKVGDEELKGLDVDEDGYVYVGNGYNYGITKLTPEGKRVWIYGGSDNGESVAVGKDRNVYAGSGNNLIKISPAGSRIWGYDPGGIIQGISVDDIGTSYISGVNIGVIKINTLGKKEWQTENRDLGSRSALDGEGNTYISSNFKDLTKISPVGVEIWQIDGRGQAITTDKNENVYLGSLTGYLSKITNAGAMIWKRQMTENRVGGVAIDNEYNIIFSSAEVNDGTIYKANQVKSRGYKIIG